jgi:hypothetical protein
MREPPTQERLIPDVHASTGQRRWSALPSRECPNGHEQLVHRRRLRRLARRLDLDAELPLRGVCIEVAWGNPATGADVREESERGDGREGVEIVAADQYRRDWLLLLLLLLLLKLLLFLSIMLVDVKDDRVRSLRGDRWNDEMAIVEE